MLPVAMLLATGCGSGWTASEKDIIEKQPDVMRVLTVDNPDDLAVLRTPCSDFTERELKSDLFATLTRKMVATVTSPEQDGVGIAGPQVGLSRRIVAVQRFDKDGNPFECYPNIRITAMRGEPVPGPEGCLSVPGRRGNVLRWRDIEICYTSIETGQPVTERVEGFTAVIFQHEVDHLDGVIYIDKLCGNKEGE